MLYSKCNSYLSVGQILYIEVIGGNTGPIEVSGNFAIDFIGAGISLIDISGSFAWPQGMKQGYRIWFCTVIDKNCGSNSDDLYPCMSLNCAHDGSLTLS